MPDLNEMLERANKSVHILCDFPGYSLFSAPHYFEKYKTILQSKKRAGLNVELTCLDQAKRKEWLAKQFADAQADWSTWSQQEPYCNLISDCCANYCDLDSTEEITLEQLLGILEEQNSHLLTDDFRLFRPKVYSGLISPHIWIRDQQEAVFAVAGPRQGETTVGFHTRDEALVKALTGLFDTYRSLAEVPFGTLNRSLAQSPLRNRPPASFAPPG